MTDWFFDAMIGAVGLAITSLIMLSRGKESLGELQGLYVVFKMLLFLAIFVFVLAVIGKLVGL